MKDMNESDEFSDDINNKEIGDLEKDNNIIGREFQESWQSLQ